MTSYIFAPASATTPSNWSDPTVWSPQGVPNSSNAEVLLPEIIDLQTGQPAGPMVQIQAGQSFQVGDLNIVYDGVINNGTLTIAHGLTVGPHGGLYDYATPAGVYVAQSLENDGEIESSAQFKISGAAINRSNLFGNLTLSAATFDNLGTLGNGNLTIAVTSPNGFVNLSGGTLTGGTYVAYGETLSFNVNQPITTLAATVKLYNSGTIQTYAATGTSTVTLQSSLATIAQSGVLEATSSYANVGALTDAGVIVAYDSAFSAASLTITSSGAIAREGGTLSAAGGIVDNGIIVTTAALTEPTANYYSSTSLVIGSPVQGNGSIVIGPAATNSFTGLGGTTYKSVPVSLELTASDTANIVFTDATATLTLDTPQSVTGTILDFTQGDTIILSGVSLASVVKTTYTGDTTHGTLTILETNGTSLSLSMRGNYTTADFLLAAGPQQLSTSPPSIILTDTASSAIDYTLMSNAIAAAQAGKLTAGSSISISIGDVVGNLDALQTLVTSGQITHVNTTDIDQSYNGGIEVLPMPLTAAQFLADAAALKIVSGAYLLSITGASVAQAESAAGGAHIASIAVSDSNADIAPQLDALQALAAKAQISSVAETDPGFTTFFLTSAQLTNDRVVLGEMTGNFTLSVTASAANLELDGVAGHAATAIFSGTASQYAIAAVGDGVGVTITDTGTGRTSVDLLRSINAVHFSDLTDIVAQTPGGGGSGSVTTGNVTELYGAVFGRLPDLPGLAYYQQQLAQNPILPLTTFAQWFLESPEYMNNPAHNYAQSTAGDTQFITDSYSNLLHRTPEAGAVPYYLNIIDSFTNGFTPGTAQYTAAQALAHAVVLTDFSASAEFLQDVQVTAATPSSAQHWLILI